MAASAEFKVPDQSLSCEMCGAEENKWQKSEDDLMICCKSQCKMKFRIRCRGCIRASHRLADHKIEENSSNFISIRGTKSCTICKIIYSQSNDIIFRVCVQDDCKYQCQIMCNECTTTTHENCNDNNIMNVEDWYLSLQMNVICSEDGVVAKTIKPMLAVVKAPAAAGLGIYALFNEKALEIITKVPAKASAKEWGTALQSAIKASEMGGMALMKSMAKSQAYINGALFIAECGYYLVDYCFFENGTREGMVEKIKVAAKANVVSWGLGVIGAGIGFLIAGPFGAGIGMALGGISGDITTRWYCNRGKITDYDKVVQAALETFDYSGERLDYLLQDTDRFNIDELTRRYHLKAMVNHPDYLIKVYRMSNERANGMFAEFFNHYMVLLDVLKERDRYDQ